MTRQRNGPVFEPPIYRFYVRLEYASGSADRIWREIELSANQTLADLAAATLTAFGFADDHLWAFYLMHKTKGVEAYAAHREFIATGNTPAACADEIQLREVPYPGKAGRKEFLFLFDFGDQWRFLMHVAGTAASPVPGTSYPRVTRGEGKAPPQYDVTGLDEGNLDGLAQEIETDPDLDSVALLRGVEEDVERAMLEQGQALKAMGLRRGEIESLLAPFEDLRARLAAQRATRERDDAWSVLHLPARY